MKDDFIVGCEYLRFVSNVIDKSDWAKIMPDDNFLGNV
jgi:hypothetical protein